MNIPIPKLGVCLEQIKYTKEYESYVFSYLSELHAFNLSEWNAYTALETIQSVMMSQGSRVTIGPHSMLVLTGFLNFI